MRNRIAALLLALVCAGVSGQTYPAKPVRLVVPFPAGGLLDVVSRGLSTELSKLWGQPVIVDNRPGANTIIGAAYVAKQPADGYTLLMATDATLSANPFLYSKLPYDPEKDFVPVVNMVATTTVLAASPELQANNLQELIQLAKSKPGSLTYGSFGAGSSTHMDMEAFASVAGIKVTHVPYKGIADVVPAMLSSQIHLGFAGIPPVLQHIRAGRLKAIAYSGAKRSPLLPDVPTFLEAGISNFESMAWFGVVAPSGTPRAVVDTIAADVAQVLSRSEFRDKFVTGVGLDPFMQGPNQFVQFLKADRVKYQQRAKIVDVKLD